MLSLSFFLSIIVTSLWSVRKKIYFIFIWLFSAQAMAAERREQQGEIPIHLFTCIDCWLMINNLNNEGCLDYW